MPSLSSAAVSGHIVAIGGGTFLTDDPDPRLDAFILSLTGKARPSVCYLGTAAGDSHGGLYKFYKAMRDHDCRPTELTFFERVVEDLDTFIAEQDVFWVAGGSTANLLAIWRLHGLDILLREAYAAGAVLCGVSAGMNCWFEASTTDSFGRTLAPLHDGLGFLRGSACPHYDGEDQRRPLFRGLIDAGTLPPGWACDDHAALHFHGDDVEAVSLLEGATGYRVEPGSERALSARIL
jgi:dipeptidase E